ncbi:hypothetical protein [Nocardioides jishulii]|uniref:Uncharacterized protein n=1 Tax=Nocardioides jishulii TaxID=2575440 RepID=A0A4V5TMQ2_9ACTN|nr:hypothetical protein [Nocardioides jishulii]QCX26223.1 hypothetical protein FCL41_00720 [Nocardioides jishulii]TKI63973.1 hypothetical protein FC770_01985 [Nocardioides jishulii]
MPTVPSSTETAPSVTPLAGASIPSVRAHGGLATPGPSRSPFSAYELRRALDDTGHLVRFWSGTIRQRKALRVALTVVALITLAAVVGPLLAPGAGDETSTFATTVLPGLFTGFLALCVTTGIGSGGGRELLSGESGAAFPVSPTTDHFGALLLAPLSTAWMLPAWFLLGGSAFVGGLSGAATMLLLAALWIVAATATGQAVAWLVELVRRGPAGVWIVRGAGLLLAAAVGAAYLTGRTVDVLRAVSLDGVVRTGLDPLSWQYPLLLLALLAWTALAVVVGAWGCIITSARPPRTELDIETRRYRAKSAPGATSAGVGAMLRRIDRASVWRSAGMRRGILVLSVGPGLVALAGGMTWENVVILPGLVVSGGVLLFGVNAFALDGRGGLWRESLPVDPERIFDSRARVMAEWLLMACALTLLLASVRAGTPTPGEVVALVCTVVVVVLQVVAVAMTWSVRKPFAVNLRSIRATPAPPATMVSYSAKLSLSTTMTAMVFSMASWIVPGLGGGLWIIAALAVPFVVWSCLRLRRARRAWVDPVVRATVVTTVAA